MVKEENKSLDKENKPFFDKVVSSNGFMKWLSGKGAIRVATAMVYERIGSSEKFIGGFPLLKGKFKIGEYLVLDYKGKSYFLDSIGSESFIPCENKKLNKIVELVKFSEDDFRVRVKLNSKEFFKKIKKPRVEKVELIEDNERIIDEEGNPVLVNKHVLDENGKQVFDEVIENYVEPLGVTQEGRESIRIHNNTSEDIKKFKERNQGFWEKHGAVVAPIIGMAIVAMMFLIGAKFMTDSWTAGVNSLTGELKDANNNLQWWQQPEALDQISDAVTKKNDENNAPPVK